MALNIKELKAAKAVATGASDVEAIEISGLGKTTFYRLKKQDDFQEAVQWFVTERIAAAENADPTSIAESADGERDLLEKLNTLAHTITDVAQKLADHLNSLNAEDISARLLPSLVKAARDVIECKRQGEDRIHGIEGLLDDLATIEAQIAQKVVNIDRSSKSGAA